MRLLGNKNQQGTESVDFQEADNRTLERKQQAHRDPLVALQPQLTWLSGLAEREDSKLAVVSRYCSRLS